MVKVIVPNKEHFKMFTDRPEILERLKGSESRCLIRDHEILGIVGVVRYWNGVGECWAYYTDEAKKRPKTLYRATRTLLQDLLISGKYHRLQASCLDELVYRRFLRHLGFSFRSALPWYGPNKENFCLFDMVI